MSSAWVAFARTGNPNHAGIPSWAAVQPHHLADDGLRQPDERGE